MIVIVEFLWFFGYLLTGLAMDMGWYSLFNAHEFSWDLYAMSALQKMYYFFTCVMLLLYAVVRWYQARCVAKNLFLDDNELFVRVNDALCAANPHIARTQDLVREIARDRGLICEPSVFIEQSSLVRVDSCKVRFLVPPALVVTSAAITGLTRSELRWLLATEISRLERGASTLQHRNKAMLIGPVIHFLFIGSFKMLGQFFSLGDRAASTGGIFTSAKALFSAIFLLVMFFAVVGNGLLALIGVGLINALLVAVLCRKWPDRRYASALLKKQGMDKPERKVLIKKLKKLLRSKEAFADEELVDCDGYLRSGGDIRLFSISNNIKTYKQQCIGLALPKRTRRAFATVAGLYVAFYLFSYPLFDIYKLAMPKSTIAKYRAEHTIIDWNPDYMAEFNYQGNPASVRVSFVDMHTANVRVKVGDTTQRGMVMLVTQAQQAERYTVARNKNMPARIMAVMFTRLGADSGRSDRDETALEQAVTSILNAKFKGAVLPHGQREGAIVRYNYKRLFNFIPQHPSDWLIKMDRRLSSPVQL